MNKDLLATLICLGILLGLCLLFWLMLLTKGIILIVLFLLIVLMWFWIIVRSVLD